MQNLVKLLVVLALAALGTVNSSQAASHTWTGAGTNGYWSTTSNWSNGAPTAAEAAPVTLVFPYGMSPICTNNIPGLTVDSFMVLGNGAVFYGSAGGTLTFRGGGGTNLISDGGYGASNAIASTLPVTLNGSNTFSVTYANYFNIQSAIGGAGDLVLIGSGDVTFGGPQANTRTGTTTILKCYLKLGKPAGVNALAGPVIVGDDDSGNSYEQLGLLASEQIPLSVSLTINGNAYFYLNGFDETVGQLNLVGALIDTQGGLLTLTTNLAIQGAGVASRIDGRLSLGGVTRAFDFAQPLSALVIGAQITDGPASAGITKNGPGELILKGTNSFTGSVIINGGSLRLQSDFALGSTTGGVGIGTNCMLWLEGAKIPAEFLALGGSMYASSDSSWAGNITLVTNAVIDVLTNYQLTLSGAINGSGQITKQGFGTLLFAGSTANTYTNTTTVKAGTLELSKTNVVAVPGPLVIGGNYIGSTNTEIVLSRQPNQIADTAVVTVATSGLLNVAYLFGSSDTIGSLSGDGNVFLGLNTLTTSDNSDTTFNGTFTGFGASGFVKQGYGTFTLNGNSSGMVGTTTINGGKLVVNGGLGGALQMNFLCSLGGTGAVGNVTVSLAHIAPGNSVGKITTGNLNLNNASSSLDAQLNGTTPGTGYDQIVANGTVSLSSPGLNIAMGFPGAVGNKYVLIANDGADAVSGTFNGLPEGASFTNNGVQFQISYHGGDGNDVELTQLSLVPASSQISYINRLPNGQIQLSGTGSSGMNYSIEANTNLSTTNWVSLGPIMADQNGAIGFTDTNAPSFPTRFYRFKAQ